MSHPAFRNYVIPVVGTRVTAYLAQRVSEPTFWRYTLETDEGDDAGYGEISLKLEDRVNLYKTSPETVAQLAFILETT